MKFNLGLNDFHSWVDCLVVLAICYDFYNGYVRFGVDNVVYNWFVYMMALIYLWKGYYYDHEAHLKRKNSFTDDV